MATRGGHIRREEEDVEDKGMIDSVRASVMEEGYEPGDDDLLATKSGGLMYMEDVGLRLSLGSWSVIGVLSLFILSSRSGILSQHVCSII